MKIYISGKVTDNPDHFEQFNKAYAYLVDKYPDAQIFNPVDIMCVFPDGLSYEEIMGFCMYILSKCGAIYMLKGWEDSKGANREYNYALGTDMVIMYEGTV